MRILILSISFLILTVTPSSAALKNQFISYQQGDANLEGYLVYDDSFTGPRPGVLVVHEWWGLNDYAKMRSVILARLGFVAFAADIYGKGIRPATPQEAGVEAGKYKNDRELFKQRVIAALDVLRQQPNVAKNKLAAIGYCFGGTAVLELARSGADIKGVVSFHGGLSTPTKDEAKNIRAQVLILHGADDPFVPPEEVADFENEMRSGQVKYSLVKYLGAVHGFTNPDNKGAIPGALYNKAADEASWLEMRKFFDRIF